MNHLRVLETAWTGFIGAIVLWSAIGCSKDDGHGHSTGGHSSVYPACDAIIKRCHPLDVGEGRISECHVLAHEAASDAECVAEKDDCFAACVPMVDGGLGDGSGDGATTDAALD